MTSPRCFGAYWTLDPPLQKILGCIKINEDERKRNNSVFHNEIGRILTEMKKDVVFKAVFKKLNYNGSTYENLKITSLNEFDLNVELKLPIDRRIEVENSMEKPGFVMLFVEDFDESAFTSRTEEKVRREIMKWFSQGYLYRTKVYEWMQGVLERALSSYRSLPSVNVWVKRRTAGPAHNLIFEHSSFGELSVDLSPTLAFGLEDWPADPVRHYYDIPFCTRLDDKNWYAVPKPPNKNYQQDPELWRISFYSFELEMMNGLESLKPVLKLMKRLRDVQDWGKISSYYLKTVFMWQLHEHEEDPSFWRMPLGKLFMLMLEKIQKSLTDGEILFFWDENLNLLNHVNTDFLTKTAFRISNMRRRILYHLENDVGAILDLYFNRKVSKEESVEQGSSQEWCCIL
ncbi:cyclic GMP-AMP synthase-like receptor isoform X2 [Bacillus rossius redtenbacheri]|uniref:cyclic GMP-AMP synthase-like receptor isoform X2 n=1 Tax=Bacillus rossius redtenbacheri TaxID=93214 RepID=UPI002FDDFD4F